MNCSLNVYSPSNITLEDKGLVLDCEGIAIKGVSEAEQQNRGSG